MRSMRGVAALIAFFFSFGLPEGGRLDAAPELIRAFAFGSRNLSCTSPNDPSVTYTVVLHGSDPAALEYDPARGWGFEVIDPGASGFARFGYFDDSPNNRNRFDDTCPEELYDSFIGMKNFPEPCNASIVGNVTEPCTPETVPGYEPAGGIFRIDLPNGRYRFVGAFGDADNTHAHRILVEDGGSGPPSAIGPNHVVLVHNFNQALYDIGEARGDRLGAGVYARVGFEGRLPPSGNGVPPDPQFVNMGPDGRETAGPPESPTLEVTQGYVRVHLLQGNSNDGPGGPGDPNGGDIVVLELWRVDSGFQAVSRGATWKYLPGLAEASSPDPGAWRLADFDDSSWPSGPAPFGYGDAREYGTDLSLLDPPMRNNYTSLYLRRTFELSDPSAVRQLVANVDYDDGFVMWINGVEVLRILADGLPGDPVPFDATATSGHESGIFEEYDLPDPSGYLVAGTNVVAVQVLNTSLTSSDLMFELELFDPFAPDLTPPEVSLIAPAPGVTLRSLSRIDVTFSEEVTGVDAGDLLVGGVPASAVTGDGRGPYTFTFDPAPPGVVLVEWRSGHGITDVADPPNPFAGGSWSYTVDPDAPVGNLVISEFLAANRTGLRDEDGDMSDWIEIANVGSETVNTAGWSLSDDPDEPARFLLPARDIPPGGFLVVFASGKDRRPPAGEIHTNFQIAQGGEFLGLYGPESPPQPVMVFAPRFPRQRPDVSYGLTAGGTLAYFSTPTPGAPNSGSEAFDGFTLEPAAVPGRGFYDDPVEVALTAPTPGAVIRYTLDGSEPTPASGTVYTGPITISPPAGRGAVNLRAIATAPGFLPSDVVTYTYIFPDDVLLQSRTPAGFPTTWNGQPADYEMDPRVVGDAIDGPFVREGLFTIPTLSVAAHVDDLFGASRGIYANPSREGVAWERPCSAELIFPGGREGFQVNCGIRVQGGSSTRNWKSLKVSLRLLFKGDYGPTKLRYPLFPDSPVRRFDTIVLDAHLNLVFVHPSLDQRRRSQYVRDLYISDLQNMAGSNAPHGFFVNLYLNGLYWGLYEIHERPDDAFAAEYFGGEKEEYDVLRHSSGNVVAGSSTAFRTMLDLSKRDLSNNANYLALQEYLDVRDLADYMIVNFYAGNDDWDHHNWYATRRRAPGAVWRFHSWDAEHVLKSVTINRLGVNNTDAPTGILTRLRQNAEFRLLFADRVQRLFGPGGILYTDPSSPEWDPDNPERNRPASLYMRRIDEVNAAVAGESARWGDSKQSTPHLRRVEFLNELNWLLTQYFPQRSEIVLDQFRSAGLYPPIDAPIFSKMGGRIQPGFLLSIFKPAGTAGTIYFTLDGTDPRVPFTGDVSESAIAYSGPVTLNDQTTVRARIRSGTTWSALTEATFTLADPRGSLVVSEIHYNPPEGPAYEFLELYNAGDLTVDLSGVRVGGAVDFIFPPGSSLGPGEFTVLVSDPSVFQARYPGVPIAGVFRGRLANEGESVELRDADGVGFFRVRYDDEGLWPIGPDGFGYSLVLVDPELSPADPDSWRASASPGGSPGADDPEPASGGVVINEVLAASTPPYEDAIELFNRTGAPVDIGGWYLSDSRTDADALKKYRIPAGTVIPAGGFAVFYAADFGAGPRGFRLDPRGGAVYLSAAAGGGALTGYIVAGEYGPADGIVSFGRFPTSAGERFGPLAGTSFGFDPPVSLEQFRGGLGAPNTEPLFGPVLINEIHYHPLESTDEFVELFNPTPVAIPLYEPGLGRGWRLRGVSDAFGLTAFEFGPGDEIPAEGYAVLAGIDPALFRTLNVVPQSAPVLGPYGGALDNGGESLVLERPIEGPDGEVLYALVDRVEYDDGAPWPERADGEGPSLERILASAYGDDPNNWDASLRDGGTPGGPNSVSAGGGNRPPAAFFRATPNSGRAPLTVFFDASQSYDLDGTIEDYVWDFGDGSGGTGRTLLHTFTDPGVYIVRLTVRDDQGAEATATAPVTVEADPGGLQIPGDSNQDAVLDVSDAVNFLRRLFAGAGVPPCGGDSLLDGGNKLLYDLNADDGVDISDVIYLLNFLFKGGPPPALGADCIPIPGCPDVCAQ